MLELVVKIREVLGSKNKQLRKKDLIPAVLYGQKVNNLNLCVDYHKFIKIYQEAGESTLIKLKIAGTDEENKAAKDRVVLIKQVDIDPVSDKIIHIDFNQIRLDKPITVEVPLEFVGESDAVKSLGGTLLKNIQDVEIEALPTELIHSIEVDISSLNTFEDSIYIKDLKVPSTVKIEAEPNDVVATVAPPRTEEELGELEEKPEESVEGVEVEEKGKDKEELEDDSSAKDHKPAEGKSASPAGREGDDNKDTEK